MPLCPHCDTEISHVTEQRYTINSQDFCAELSNWNERDSAFTRIDFLDEDEGNSQFNRWLCPECGENLEIEDINHLLHLNQPQVEPRISEVYSRGQITVNPNHTPEVYVTVDENGMFRMEHRNTQNTDRITECPKCHHVYHDELSEEMICPKCNYTYNHKQNA